MFLTYVAEQLQVSGVLPSKSVVLRKHRIEPMVRGYYLLNEAYKKWRINSGHRTEKPKIAALQATVIVRFQPFLPLKPERVQTPAEARCNEIFACAYALGILGKAFTPDSPQKEDFWFRLLEIVAASPIETLEPYVQDVEQQINQAGDYTLVILKQDKHKINSLISVFELMSDKASLLV